MQKKVIQNHNMKIQHIVVVKETRDGEGRVALTPQAIQELTQQCFSVVVEHHAGLLAGFKDEDYVRAGARIAQFQQDGFPEHSIIVRVKRPEKTREFLEHRWLSSGMAMMGFLDPMDKDGEGHIKTWQALGVQTIRPLA